MIPSCNTDGVTTFSREWFAKITDCKIGVADFIPAIHLANYTIKKFKSQPANYNYNEIAEANMHAYFRRIDRYEEFLDMRELAHKYSWTPALTVS